MYPLLSNVINVVDPFLSLLEVDNDTLSADGSSQAVISITPKNNSDTLLTSGLEVLLSNTGNGTLSEVTDSGNGLYFANITAPQTVGTDTISAIVVSGSDTVIIFEKAVLAYIMPVKVSNEEIDGVDRYFLYQNFPQPFNPTTTIKYQIANIRFVKLKVYDVLGNEIATLVEAEKSAGNYEVEFDGTGLPSGIYFYKLQAGNFVETKKMLLLK